MVDRLTPSRRSYLMSRVRSKNTGPELHVRRKLYALGYRFRLHGQNLPGKPDIVLPKYHAVIFVHGCFWHRHSKCKKASMPSSNVEFWKNKFERNVARDRANRHALRRAKWRVLTIWQCEIKSQKALEKKLKRFLEVNA